ncbi:tetratricopeptide repeat protein [Streptomyces sp. NPDC059003]|uniref:tetratricopeptide repeat protein n=1 Tax=Streptomyces sp. NPDC059003 TaxID=3346691 RepID=UPI0036B5FE2F
MHTVGAFFARTTSLYGGGHARTAFTCYLAHDATAWLSAPATDSVHRQLLTGIAQLAILLGNMCADDFQDALAQHYHRTAAHLAADAHDPATYALALRAMATHAHELGHYQQALTIARQAACTARHHAPALTRAYIQSQLAVAEARTHHTRPALTALKTAEHLYSQADPTTSGPFTHYTPADLHFQQARIHAALNNHTGTLAALTTSLRTRPSTSRRAYALTLAYLAETHLRRGHLESALAAWEHFLNNYPALHSARATRRLNIMRQLLRPHTTHPAADALLHRAIQLH